MTDLEEKSHENKIEKYYKEIEHFAYTFKNATVLADKLFEPYQKDAGTQERTCSKAKVRIRRQKETSGANDYFRVILYRTITVKRNEKSEVPVADVAIIDAPPSELPKSEEPAKAEEREKPKKKSAKRIAREEAASKRAKQKQSAGR